MSTCFVQLVQELTELWFVSIQAVTSVSSGHVVAHSGAREAGCRSIDALVEILTDWGFRECLILHAFDGITSESAESRPTDDSSGILEKVFPVRTNDKSIVHLGEIEAPQFLASRLIC